MSKNYFNYLIKKYKRHFIVGAVIALLIAPLTIIMTKFNIDNLYFVGNEQVLYKYIEVDYEGIISIIASMFIFSYLVPLLLNGSLYSKRYLDSLYSLPIKRGKIFTTNYLFGLLVNFIYLFISVLVSVIIMNLKGVAIHFGVVLLLLLFLLLLNFVIYTLASLGTVLASNHGENLILQVVLFFIPSIFAFMSFLFTSTNIKLMNYDILENTLPAPSFISIISGLWSRVFVQDNNINDLVTQLNETIRGSGYIGPSVFGTSGRGYYYLELGLSWQSIFEKLPAAIIWTIVSVPLSFLFVFLGKIKKAEGAGLPSNQIYGLKLLFPITFTLLLLFISLSSRYRVVNLGDLFSLSPSLLTTYIFLFVGFYVINFALNRSVKLKKSDLIVFLCIIGSYIVYHLALGIRVL